jgi:hypothetical protein
MQQASLHPSLVPSVIVRLRAPARFTLRPQLLTRV